MNQAVRAPVLMPPEDAGRSDAVCQNGEHKMPTLIARLIRKHRASKGYGREALRRKHSA
jgi:hypothetical protein